MRPLLGATRTHVFSDNVALMPYSPEDLLSMARQEWNRAVAFEAFEKNRNHDVPPLKTADNVAAALELVRDDEGDLRARRIA